MGGAGDVLPLLLSVPQAVIVVAAGINSTVAGAIIAGIFLLANTALTLFLAGKLQHPEAKDDGRPKSKRPRSSADE